MKISVSHAQVIELLEPRIAIAKNLVEKAEQANNFQEAYEEFKQSHSKWHSYNEDLLQKIYGAGSKPVIEYDRSYDGSFLVLDQDIWEEIQCYKAEIKSEQSVLESCLERLGLYEEMTAPVVSPKVKTGLHIYINAARIDALKNVKGHDPIKLIRLCEELNQAFQTESFLSTIMLLRAILDHVPPIFGVDSFAKVANSYPGSRSFKESMDRLDSSSRKIADAHLHTQIRKKESIPNATQVDYSND